MFLYLTLVLPASMPSAVFKVMVIVGPFLEDRFDCQPASIKTATIGISQMSWGDLRRFGTATPTEHLPEPTRANPHT